MRLVIYLFFVIRGCVAGTEWQWTKWYNTDQPGGAGDVEKLSRIRQIDMEMCLDPIRIEAQTRTGLNAMYSKQRVHYSKKEGFWCLNKEQKQGDMCLDYKVRFLCPKGQMKDLNENPNLPTHTQELVFNESKDPWFNWSSWSRCDVTCGGTGNQRRIKRCQRTATENIEVEVCDGGEVIESKPCGQSPCTPDIKKCETSGRILDTTNIPLQGVEVGLGTMQGLSFTPLTYTDENGDFGVLGICADSSNAHLVARKRNYVTTRVHLRVNKLGNAEAKVRMLAAEFPTIYEQPISRARFVDQSVKFCCKARGSAKEQIYVWYHNNTLLDPASYSRDQRVLELHNLKPENAGIYYCKVESLATAEKASAISQTAILTLRHPLQPACDETPVPNIIKLPDDCAVQNSTLIDIGTCAPTICPASTQSTNGCGDQGAVYCCGPVERETIEISCEGYQLPVQKVRRCGCQKCVKPTIQVRGRAYGDDAKDPLRFGLVYQGNKQVTMTAYDGTFFYQVPARTERLILTFKDRFDKFVTTTKILPFKKLGGVTYHEIKMARKAPVKVFHSKQQSITSLSGHNNDDEIVHLVTGQQSFYKKDGKPYNGMVRGSVTFIDPRSTTSYTEASSDLTFANSDGKVLPLTTYGMFDIDFRDDEMNELNMAKLKVFFNPASIASTSHLKNLKLWSLNQENGLWEVEDIFQTGKLEIRNESDSGYIRRKREAQTFLIGNLEVRERRLFNLDVPSENRCWIKVRAYRSPEFKRVEQVVGAEVTVINMEPNDGFRGNPQAWGRFDTKLTEENGACIRAFCHSTTPDAYKAIVTAKFESSEELYAAPSTFPLDPEIVGIRGEVLKKLQYERSDHDEATGKKTSFRTNLPKPKPGTKLTGPVYPEENLNECVHAPVTDNHFRFYRTEDYLYEYNTIYINENDCITWTPNYLNWWPNPTEYRACYIKVHLESSSGSTVRVKSFGGTHSLNKDKLYGIRDDRSVIVASKSPEGHLIRESAACIEFKCSGMLYDFEAPPDRTLVSVVPQGSCYLKKVNPKLSEYLTDHPPTIEGTSINEFRMYAPMDSLGHSYGIYTVTDDNPLSAKRLAIGRCYAGSSDVVSKVMKPRAGVGLYYRCSNGDREQEMA